MVGYEPAPYEFLLTYLSITYLTKHALINYAIDYFYSLKF